MTLKSGYNFSSKKILLIEPDPEALGWVSKFISIFSMLLICCLIVCTDSHAKNLLPNSSFELTTVPDMPDGYDQYLGAVGVMDWFDLWSIDRTTAYEGNNSLRLKILSSNQIGKIFVKPERDPSTIKQKKWERITAGKYYTFSLYMRSDREAFPVEIMLDDRRIAHLGRSWKRYSFTTKVEIKKDESLLMQIMPKAIGTIWIDCLQLEEGKFATPYEPSMRDSDQEQYPPPESRESIKKRITNKEIKSGELRVIPQLSYYSNESEAIVLFDKLSTSFSLANAKLKVFIIDKYGKTVLEAAESVTLDPGASRAILKLNIKDIGNGKYKLKGCVISDGKKFVCSESEFIKQAPSQNEAKIDHLRRCILLEGKPFLVSAATIMRVYSYSDHLPELLQMIKDQGYTAVIPTFTDASSDIRSSDSEILRFCDLADRIGLKVIPWIQPNAIKTETGSFKGVYTLEPNIYFEKYLEEFMHIIPLLKNHPALLAWYLCDEPSDKQCEAGFTFKLMESARLLDPTHPLYINYYNDATDYKLYKGKVPGDIVSKTIYPIPFRPITLVAYRMEEALQSGEHIKPVFPWLQLWGGQSRYPTPAEFQCMAYLALVSGATGIQTWPTMPSSKILWNRVKNVNKEIKGLEQFIFSEAPSPVLNIDSEFIFYMGKVIDNRLHLLALNSSHQDLSVNISAPNLLNNAVSAKIMFEDRVISINQGLFTDHFGPLERHVYVIDFQ